MTTLIVMIFMGLLGVSGLIFFIVALVKAFTKKTPGWIITCVIMGVFGLLMLLGMGGAVVYRVSQALSEGTKPTQVLNTKDRAHQISVPGSWKPMPQMNTEAEIAAGSMLKEQYLIVLIEKKEAVGVGLARYMEFTSDRMASALKNGAKGEATKLSISGHPALRRRITGQSERLNLAYLHTCVETEQSLVQILCWTLAGREATAFPVFEQVAATFRASGKTASSDTNAPTTEPENAKMPNPR